MHPIFHDIQRFLAEWHAARESLNPREQEALDAITTQPKKNAALAEKYGVTSGRIQQINGVAMRKVRRWAWENHADELLHTAQAVEHVAQRAGLCSVFHFRRMRNRAFQQLAGQLLRLEAITEDETPHLRQACALAAANSGWQRSLENATRDIRKLLEQRRRPMPANEVLELLPQRRQELDRWTQLDMCLFAKAWLGADYDEKGRITLRTATSRKRPQPLQK